MIARSPDVLYCDLYDLQRAGVMVDTRLILDDGELAIHWSMLDLFGYEQWWTGLGEAGADNVVIMPGVSLIEAEQFVDILYVGQNVTLWGRGKFISLLNRIESSVKAFWTANGAGR